LRHWLRQPAQYPKLSVAQAYGIVDAAVTAYCGQYRDELLMAGQPLPCQADPDLWFGRQRHVRERAKLLCITECPLSEFRRCARTALTSGEEYGIWAGIELPGRENLNRDKAKLAAARQQLQAIAAGHYETHPGAA